MEVIGYPRYLIFPNGEVVGTRGKVLKYDINNKGYKQVKLYNEDGKKNHYIHRLVAIHYIPNPNNYKEVDHFDRNPLNNDISNLRWVTSSENSQNRGMISTNKSGIKNISYHKRYNLWRYVKEINGNSFEKRFKTKIDAICYKFIIQLRIRARHLSRHHGS